MLVSRLQSVCVPRIAGATTVNAQALSPGQSTLSTVQIPTRPFASQLHSTPSVDSKLWGRAVWNHQSPVCIESYSVCENGSFGASGAFSLSVLGGERWSSDARDVVSVFCSQSPGFRSGSRPCQDVAWVLLQATRA